MFTFSEFIVNLIHPTLLTLPLSIPNLLHMYYIYWSNNAFILYIRPVIYLFIYAFIYFLMV